MNNDNIKTENLPNLLGSFEAKALNQFHYLSKFGFGVPNIKKSSTWVLLQYQNEIGVVKINFSVLDQTIYTDILKIMHNGEIAKTTDNNNTISLSSLVMYHDPNNPIFEKLHVRNGDFEEPLAISAELLKRYGSEILSGQKWISEKQALEKINRKV